MSLFVLFGLLTTGEKSLWNDFALSTTATEAECASELTITKDIPYLALTGKLWDVYCDNFGENWPHYNSTAL